MCRGRSIPSNNDSSPRPEKGLTTKDKDPSTNFRKGCFLKDQRRDTMESFCVQMTHKKTVSFDKIRILEFPLELGDNPSVHEGPPLTLSWKPHTITEQRLDVYEIFRDRRRDRHALILSTRARMEALLSEGHSLDEISQATQECEKAKQQSRSITGDTHISITMIQAR